ncbi:hypothetical protein W97_04155 [Coniosporium apollinis CBS 100218]|uniref:Pre-mRNA-processing factor 39 n=1 Tax=Coniosporium apollinis (strain CBS 100218) TaxID=1168221 RepID=R7YTA6_CONA1|nr:uncharacterized protein W97_04155 [Coniosporium apollinis CBS 100218]EON64921.1 hypothetical protein W97_04155 [Coniosporium apollinis CBS 100218]
MADISFGGTDEENAELRKLNAEVLANADEFESWEKLVRAAESQEGGLNRNSSPQAIASARNVYDRLLARFPLFFGYWKKYADIEFSIAGTEAAEMVYERGVASITNSVDLWTNYCAFKVETSHDSDLIRELFERGANCVGLDFLAHPFWDKYVEFEERLEAQDRIFGILTRVIHIPMHQYARYFERYRTLAASRPIIELAPSDVVAQLRSAISMDPMLSGRGDAELERELRTRIDNFHLEIFNRTQTETTKRWTYEQEIKRPYFHVTDLDDAQLTNWRRYLDFEESEGDYQRVVFLYERCLVTAALYDEFWLRYSRWMLAQPGKEEEVRNIYQRASCLYVAIAEPLVRHQYALFEEMTGRVDVARAIYEAILINIPGHIDTIIMLATLQLRHSGLEAAIATYREQIESPSLDTQTKGALVSEWARLLWKIEDLPEEARQVYQKNQHWYLDVERFWINYFMFELEQPTNSKTKSAHHARVKGVLDQVRQKSRIPAQAVHLISDHYMNYLLERGIPNAAKERLLLDKEINGTKLLRTGDRAQ